MSGVYPMRAYSIQAIVPNNLAVGNVTVDLLLLKLSWPWNSRNATDPARNWLTDSFRECRCPAEDQVSLIRGWWPADNCGVAW